MGIRNGAFIVETTSCIVLAKAVYTARSVAMNPYEKAREERIKRNNAMLAQLEVGLRTATRTDLIDTRML